MRNSASIEISKEQAKLLVTFLRKSPLSGSFEDLPSVLMQVSDLLKKIEGAFKEEVQPVPVAAVTKAPRRKRK